MVEGLISQSDAVQQAVDRFQKNRISEYGLLGHDMGIHDFNLMLGGWIPKKVTTIAGRSGMGKTALITPMIDAGEKVINGRRAEFMFCSWEMSADYIVDRLVCYRTGLSSLMLNQGAKLLSEARYKEVQKAFLEAKKSPVHYQPMSTDINTIRIMFTEFVEECKKKSKIEGVEIIPVCIVDYIGMAQFDSAGLRTYGIGDFMNGAKQIANNTGGAFCILAQINRTADDKAIPQKSDLSDSQSIENASDNLVIAHRPEYNHVPTIKDPNTSEEVDSRGKMFIRVAKGRDFGTGDTLIKCSMKNYRFWSMNHDFDYDYRELYSKKDFWLNHFGLDKGVEF